MRSFTSLVTRRRGEDRHLGQCSGMTPEYGLSYRPLTNDTQQPSIVQGKMKRLAIFVGLALLALGPVGSSSARNSFVAGTLDTSFSAGRVVTHTPVPNESASIEAVAVQPDGKIVVAAVSGRGDHGLLLARYVPSGALDTSFGDGGYVETPVGDWANAEAIALQPDGKIVVAGTRSPQAGEDVQSEFALARYNPNGSLDTSFGTDGITSTVIPESPPPSTPTSWSLPPFADVSSLAILPGGEILVGGSAGFEIESNFMYGSTVTSFFALARYGPDGSLDTAFGDGGIVQTRFDGDLTLSGIALRPDGRIVAVGSASGGEHPYYTSRTVAVRYNPDGSLDPTFGHVGKVATSAAFYFDGGPFALLENGRIFVSGQTHDGLAWFARFTANGRIDHTFGKQGYAKVERPAASHVLAQRDGKVVFAAYDSTDGLGLSTVYRLLPDGRLDTSFGTGKPLELPGAVSTLALQPDQKILLGGGDGDMWTLARIVGGNNCVVPGLHGKTVRKADAELKASYCLRGSIAKQFSSTVRRGRVISTLPVRAARLPGGTRVNLVVSRGKRP